jgi:uncharacterized protein
MSSLQNFVRLLLPKEDAFYDLLEKQANVAHRAAIALCQFAPAGTSSARDVSARVQEIEHEGDALLHALEDALARTFVTPIDREDIQHMAARLDDITDNINLTARSFALYGVKTPTPEMVKLMTLLQDATLVLRDALPMLRKSQHPQIIEAVRKIKAIEKDGDTVFRDAVARLFSDDSIDAKTLLREKETLEDLEEAVDTCEDTAEYLAQLAIKHG